MMSCSQVLEEMKQYILSTDKETKEELIDDILMDIGIDQHNFKFASNLIKVKTNSENNTWLTLDEVFRLFFSKSLERVSEVIDSFIIETQPKPITLAELSESIGRLVWIESINYPHNSNWKIIECIECIDRRSFRYKDISPDYNGFWDTYKFTDGEFRYSDEYGQEWMAWTDKPQAASQHEGV